MRKILMAAATLLAAAVAPTCALAQAESATNSSQAEADYKAHMNVVAAGLHRQTGTVAIPVAKASLALGDDYYFLPADEAKRVLTEAWGNPPEAVADVLGMVFPVGHDFRDAGWGAVVRYEDTGHVDDKDAANEDYNAVLSQMQEADVEGNKLAKEKGYPESHTVGWAQPPSYDGTSKTLIWARDLRFANAGVDTLNYDVRHLGRTGVLSLNMVDSMPHLAAVRSAAESLGKTASFDTGSGYADFNRGTDKLADYGLAGLVAGGAGLLIAKKVGMLGIILLFLKKGIVILIALAAGGWRWFKRKIGRGEDEGDGYAG